MNSAPTPMPADGIMFIAVLTSSIRLIWSRKSLGEG